MKSFKTTPKDTRARPLRLRRGGAAWGAHRLHWMCFAYSSVSWSLVAFFEIALLFTLLGTDLPQFAISVGWPNRFPDTPHFRPAMVRMMGKGGIAFQESYSSRFAMLGFCCCYCCCFALPVALGCILVFALFYLLSVGATFFFVLFPDRLCAVPVFATFSLVPFFILSALFYIFL